MMPGEFAQILDHVRSTPPETGCDYRYIESLFKSVAHTYKFKIDTQFDWNTMKKSKTQTMERSNTYDNTMHQNRIKSKHPEESKLISHNNPSDLNLASKVVA
jgi:hypothetical protein